MRRNGEELAKMRKAGKVVAEMHEKTRAAARPGVTTAELDAVARDVLERRGATSNFLGYHGFPAVICTSPNSMIVHGIPGKYRLEEGDILSIDCGANYSTAAPPLVNWTCDVCGGEVVQREDDTVEAIQRRLDLYEAETAPLIAWYTERSLLVSINGTGSADAVTRRVVGAIDTRRRKLRPDG